LPNYRKDDNQDYLVAAIIKMGYGWLDMTQQRPSVGFDGFLLAQGRMIPCEIKNPDLKWTYTKKEKDAAINLGKFGVTIYTIEYPEDILIAVEQECENGG